MRRHDTTLTIFSAYRPNTLTGPFSVHAQHPTHMLTANGQRYPKEAFVQHICKALKKAKQVGKVILLLDGNSDLRSSFMATLFETTGLWEVLLACHSRNGPSTFNRNTSNTPIDGIWASHDITIQQGGYMAHEQIIINSEQRVLWIYVNFQVAFGHNMPALEKPKT